MTQRIAVVLAGTALLAGLLSGCGSDESGQLKNSHQGRDPTQTTTGDLTLFGTSKSQPSDQGGSGIVVNAYLWRGTLETLKFMPLTSADPYGGVIITDWWTPPSSTSERFKATAYVVSRQLRADGIRMSLFRQVQQNGQWVDAPVDPAKPTELENMVLVKARELRAAAAASAQ